MLLHYASHMTILAYSQCEMLNCVKNKGIRGQLLPVMCKIFQSTCFELGSTYRGKTVPLKKEYVKVSYFICGLHIHWRCPRGFVSLLFLPPFLRFVIWVSVGDERFPKKRDAVQSLVAESEVVGHGL